ncbi:alkaline phosphatase D family protein [Cerasicoccus maritimus]|uniref:alkaline phosphatase D family protein n=1 Tax=Cerasicoccus maritimus TaxID=490089 RepID=UPI002852AE7B|nr:alkaline phosphatase D family protein [Cerasicoccus maritimus]
MLISMNGMNRRACLLLLLSCAPLWAKFPTDFESPLTTIAFGSCNQHNLPQPLWAVIDAQQPDLWIWAGDNIYGDTEDMTILKEKYDAQFNQPDYATFRKTTPVLGTWDDHDYGANDAGHWYPMKAESSVLALDFYETPTDDPRRQHEGIYGSYVFGPEGKRVRVILIDDRYFAGQPKTPGSDLLGDAQWAWLQQELLASKAQINLIVTGIQFLSEQHLHEKWANYPPSRAGLLNFIRENQIPGVVFLSGDRHLHEISIKSDAETIYPLIDVTSSGLTHYWKNFPGEDNHYRSGPIYSGLAFGLIELDWDAQPATLTAKIVNQSGITENVLSLPIGALRDTSPSRK